MTDFFMLPGGEFMLDILRNSFCYCFIIKFITFFSESFEGSYFRKFVFSFRLIFTESVFFHIVEKYFDKKPFFLDSLVYRRIKALGKYLGKFADCINSIVINVYRESFLNKILSFFKSEDRADKVISAGLFFMTMALSFLVFSVLFGRNHEIRIYVSWALFFVGILTVSAGKNIDTVKQSVTYRTVKFMIELVKM